MTGNGSASGVFGFREALGSVRRFFFLTPFSLDDDSVHDQEDLRARDFQDLQSTEEGPIFEDVTRHKKFDLVTGHIMVPMPLAILVPGVLGAVAFFFGLNFAWNSSEQVAEFADKRNSERARVEQLEHQVPPPVSTPAVQPEAKVEPPVQPPPAKKRKPAPKPKPKAAEPVAEKASKSELLNKLGTTASPKVERPGAK